MRLMLGATMLYDHVYSIMLLDQSHRCSDATTAARATGAAMQLLWQSRRCSDATIQLPLPEPQVQRYNCCCLSHRCSDAPLLPLSQVQRCGLSHRCSDAPAAARVTGATMQLLLPEPQV